MTAFHHARSHEITRDHTRSQAEEVEFDYRFSLLRRALKPLALSSEARMNLPRTFHQPSTNLPPTLHQPSTALALFGGAD